MTLGEFGFPQGWLDPDLIYREDVQVIVLLRLNCTIIVETEEVIRM